MQLPDRVRYRANQLFAELLIGAGVAFIFFSVLLALATLTGGAGV